MTEQNPNGRDNEESPDSTKVEGEGSYDAAREFDANQTQFIQQNPEEIETKAREAADAVESPEEGEELNQAEAESRERGAGMGEV